MAAGIRKASQVAFIGNMAFLVSVLLKYNSFIRSQDLVSLLLVMGWFMGFWVNFSVNIWVFVLVLRRRLASGSGPAPAPASALALVPRWLVWTNALLLLVEIYCYLFI